MALRPAYGFGRGCVASWATVRVCKHYGDVEGLNDIEINPVSTSPKAIARYRDLAIWR